MQSCAITFPSMSFGPGVRAVIGHRPCRIGLSGPRRNRPSCTFHRGYGSRRTGQRRVAPVRVPSCPRWSITFRLRRDLLRVCIFGSSRPLRVGRAGEGGQEGYSSVAPAGRIVKRGGAVHVKLVDTLPPGQTVKRLIEPGAEGTALRSLTLLNRELACHYSPPFRAHARSADSRVERDCVLGLTLLCEM